MAFRDRFSVRNADPKTAMPQQTLTGVWRYLPTFDGQTVFSIIIGALLTIVTFWIGYKKTIGATEERIRASNQQLISSVLKRIAVEREPIDMIQYFALQTAKSYRNSVPAQRLISFADVLAIVFLETIDNNFLDAPSKTAVISLIDKSKHETTTSAIPDLVSSDPTHTPFEKRALTTAWLATIAGFIGAIASLVSVNSEFVSRLYNYFAFFASHADVWTWVLAVVAPATIAYTITRLMPGRGRGEFP